MLAALAVLRERDREALTLVAWDGLTPAQAAAALGVPSARFRQRLNRAGAACAPSSTTCAPLNCDARSSQPPPRPRPHRRPRMKTRLDPDPDAIDLVRRADPMRDPRVPGRWPGHRISAAPHRP